ncbi:MarR family winged helix-turn-helix transcriptional regulator [Pseudonocardia sp. GCM10023141]|uniref:MarR family winged helix-turn-helix transcriptional regulator n=1 Tax=Pseudonocardia sp. GCM10023141 TaxID=3252653 RepID=UPI00360AF7DE
MPDRFDEDDVARLRIALARIARQLDRQTRGDSLTRTQASTLATVNHNGPLRISELADLEGVNPTMLSRIVAKLEDRGLLVRSPDPADGRAARVETTPEGRELTLRLRAERTRLLAERLATMPDTGATPLLAALPALEALAAALQKPPENA